MFNDVHACLDHTRAKSYCMIAWSPSWAGLADAKGNFHRDSWLIQVWLQFHYSFHIQPLAIIGHWLVVSALLH